MNAFPKKAGEVNKIALLLSGCL